MSIGLKSGRRARRDLRGLQSVLLVAALGAVGLARAQTSTATAPDANDSLTWRGITLYGNIDVGFQYESHGAPFSDFYTPASTNIVQKDSHESVYGMTGSNLSQSKVGLRGLEPIVGDWSGVFALETWFNPQAAELSNSLKSLVLNNGLSPGKQTTNNDGASAGQIFQIAYAGVTSKTFGTLTFGRQQLLVADGINALDPNQAAPAFSLLGASGAYAGAGSTEDKRMDSTVKYRVGFADTVHIGALYKFNNSNGGSAGTAIQANVGGQYAGLVIEAYYSKIYDAISLTSLSTAQLAELPKLGFSSINSLSATISDNTTYAVMASYKFTPVPVKLYAGYEHIQYANPATDVAAGTVGLGGYIGPAYATASFQTWISRRHIMAIARTPTAPAARRGAPPMHTRFAAEHSWHIRWTLTIDLRSASTPTQASCTAVCQMAWPTVTCTLRPTSIRPSACDTVSDVDAMARRSISHVTHGDRVQDARPAGGFAGDRFRQLALQVGIDLTIEIHHMIQTARAD